MLEAVWENSYSRSLGKAYRKTDSPQHESFSKKLSDTNDAGYRSAYDAAPTTAFGKQYTHLQMGDTGLAQLLAGLPDKHPNKALFLAHNNITDQGLLLLAKQLQTDQIIQHLILSNNNIQVSEFAKAGMSDLLKINRTIGWLVFGHNNIHDQGLKNLGLALKENSSVKHLVLSQNAFSDDGFCFLLDCVIDHPTLESIFVAGNQLSDACLQPLASFMKRSAFIKRIDIRGINATASQLTKAQFQAKQHSVRLLFSDN